MPVVASYPASTATFSTKFDFTDVVFAAHINALQLEVVAIQNAIGTNPQGVAASLRARVEAIESEIATLQSFFDGSGHLPESSVTGLTADLAAINAAITAGLGARLLASANLSDLPNKVAALTTLGGATAGHTHGGLVSSVAQSFDGLKTFNDGMKAAAGKGMVSFSVDFGTDGGTRGNSTAWGLSLGGSGSLIDSTFIAPPTGKAVLIMVSRINTASVADAWFSTRVRLNPTGAILADFSTDYAVFQASDARGQISGMAYRILNGMTPGATYRVQGGFRSVGGTSTFDSFGVLLLPSLST